MKLTEKQKLLIAGAIAVGGITYIMKKEHDWTSDLKGLNINLDTDKLSSSIGQKLRNNPDLVKSLGKSFLNNEKVKQGTKNLARKAFVKMMLKK